HPDQRTPRIRLIRSLRLSVVLCASVRQKSAAGQRVFADRPQAQDKEGYGGRGGTLSMASRRGAGFFTFMRAQRPAATASQHSLRIGSIPGFAVPSVRVRVVWRSLQQTVSTSGLSLIFDASNG